MMNLDVLPRMARLLLFALVAVVPTKNADLAKASKPIAQKEQCCIFEKSSLEIPLGTAATYNCQLKGLTIVEKPVNRPPSKR
jgi:hypothetical protein